MFLLNCIEDFFSCIHRLDTREKLEKTIVIDSRRICVYNKCAGEKKNYLLIFGTRRTLESIYRDCSSLLPWTHLAFTLSHRSNSIDRETFPRFFSRVYWVFHDGYVFFCDIFTRWILFFTGFRVWLILIVNINLCSM